MLIALNILGVFIFMFIYWKKLKDEYSSEIVFSSVFTYILFLLIFLFVSYRTSFEYWFWFTFAALPATGLFLKLKRKMSLYELLDAFAIAVIPWLVLLFTAEIIITGRVLNLVWAILFCLIAILYKYLESRYKLISWYKSGKIGFLGLVSVLVYFLFRGVASLIGLDLVSVVKYDFILSFILVIIVITLLIIRSSDK